MTRTRRLSLIASCIEYRQNSDLELLKAKIAWCFVPRNRSTAEAQGKYAAKAICNVARYTNRIAKLEKGL